MLENQSSIVKWANETFGQLPPPKSDKRIERDLVEMSEQNANLAAELSRLSQKLGGPAVILCRANEEMAEAISSIVTGGSPQEVSNEMADVLIVLFQACEAVGFDLMEQVDRKMKVNRNRKWKTSGWGIGQHIPSTKEFA